MSQFENLIKQAVALKSKMLKEERPLFDALPDFLRTGLFFQEETRNLRHPDPQSRLQQYEVLKKQGNLCYQTQNYSKAIIFYQKGLCLFRFIQSSQPDWKNKGIADKNLTFFRDDQLPQYSQAAVTLLLNIANSFLKLKDIKQSLEACNQAQKLNDTYFKIYFVKARCILGKPSLQFEDYDEAIELLKRALSLQKNQEINALLVKTKLERSAEWEKQKKTFKFIVQNTPEALQQQSTPPPPQSTKSTLPSVQVHTQKLSEKTPLKIRQEKLNFIKLISNMDRPLMRLKENFVIKKGDKILAKYIVQGYKQQAEQLKSLLQAARKSINLNNSKQLRQQFNLTHEEVLKNHEKILDKFLQWVFMRPTSLTAYYSRNFEASKEVLRKLIDSKKNQQKAKVQNKFWRETGLKRILWAVLVFLIGSLVYLLQ